MSSELFEALNLLEKERGIQVELRKPFLLHVKTAMIMKTPV